MQEFFFTLLSIWVLYKLFDAFSFKGRSTSNDHAQPQRRQGEVRMNSSETPKNKIPPTEGEYVDYEEIKD